MSINSETVAMMEKQGYSVRLRSHHLIMMSSKFIIMVE